MRQLDVFTLFPDAFDWFRGQRHVHNAERNGFEVRFADIPVVTAFFRRKLRHYLGAIAPLALAIGNPDRLPLPMRTNFYLVARKRG